MATYKYYTRTSIRATTGLVAAYSFSPETVSNGTLIDISGNGNHGTINGALLTKDGMFPGNGFITVAGSDSIDCNVKTLCYRYKIKGQGIMSVYRQNLTYKFKVIHSSPNLLISDGGLANQCATVQVPSLFDNNYHNVVIVYTGVLLETKVYFDGVLAGTPVLIGTTYGDSGTITIGNRIDSAHDFIGDLIDMRIYNYTFTADQAKAYHNSFIKPYLLENFSNHPVGGTFPKGWVKGTGAYKIQEETVGNSLLPLGTKYLQNTTSGTIAIQSKQAYGEWEFDVYKGAGGNIYFNGFVNSGMTFGDTNNGYNIAIDANENLRLQRSTSGSRSNLFQTADSYISNNTWYRIKVARLKSSGTFSSIVPSMTTVYPANTFAVFIKGGSFGDNYQLISTAGGSGSNPVTDSTYTTSEFFVAHLCAGGRIANIKLLNGVKQ